MISVNRRRRSQSRELAHRNVVGYSQGVEALVRDSGFVPERIVSDIEHVFADRHRESAGADLERKLA